MMEQQALTKPLIYSCEYRCPNGSRFSSEVLATPQTIDSVLAARNMKEWSDYAPTTRNPRHKPLSVLLARDGVTPKTLHYACLIGWMAIKSGAATVDEILGDCGLLHELLHVNGGIELATENNFAGIVEMAHRIECAIPGASVNPVPPNSRGDRV